MNFSIDVVLAQEGTAAKFSAGDGVYLVGRGEGSKIRLPFPDVSDRHALISISHGTATIEDLDSANGTFVNGAPVTGPVALSFDSVVQIGDSFIRVYPGDKEVPATEPIAERDVMPPEDDRAEEPVLHVNAPTRGHVGELPDLGPLSPLLADEDVTEIMVNGPSQVYVERHGRLEPTDIRFADDAEVSALIERIAAMSGRGIDENRPCMDSRLPDGSRVNAIIPPLVLTGPTLTIRKFSRQGFSHEELVRRGTWTHDMAEFMKACVAMRRNIIVAGGTGSGKTTLLNLLSGFVPPTERIVTIEDAAELRLEQPHVVRLEARPADVAGWGAVTIRDLVRNSLRMRPDRIIVGECRGGEALDMLQAMNTGHDGSLTTLHANSPRDVVARLETMVLMGGMDLPSRAIREQIASAIDLVIQTARLSDGSRRVIAISEVMGIENGQVVMQDLFIFRQNGVAADGTILGDFRPTGAIPTFFEQFKSRGIHLDAALFTSIPTLCMRQMSPVDA